MVLESFSSFFLVLESCEGGHSGQGGARESNLHMQQIGRTPFFLVVKQKTKQALVKGYCNTFMFHFIRNTVNICC